MIIQSVWQKSFDFFRKPVVVKPSEASLSSDAGLLPIRQFDQHIGLTEQCAAVLRDLRYEPFVDHSLLEMVRMRVFGILADYPDQNDHDVLRADPVFKLIAGRSPDADDLAKDTSNLPISEWQQVFQGERMTAALLDRLTHRCHIFEMNGESYRFRESMKAKKAKKKR